jgi:hypothetical protein
MVAGCDASVHAEGTLVLRLEHLSETGRDWVISLYDDGRILTPGTAYLEYDEDSWMIVRRLTDDGVQTLVSAVVDTGLFEESDSYQPVQLPGVEPPARGGSGYAVTLVRDGQSVDVTWTSMFGDDELYYEPSPEREELDAMGVVLVTLDEWLPDDAWASAESCPYQPQAFRVIVVEPQPWGGAIEDLPADVADIDWPLGGDFLAWGEPFSNPGSDPNVDGRCGVVSREEAIDLVGSLVAQGADPQTDSAALDASRYVSLMLGDAAAVAFHEVAVEALLPDAPDCSDAHTPSFSRV